MDAHTGAVPDLTQLLLDPAAIESLRVVGHTDAAVLVALHHDDTDGWVAVLTERRHDLRKHAGEICFPGGRRDPGEALLTTALREAEEEIGLASTSVEVVGALRPVTTLVTGYRVFPYVAVVAEPRGPWTPQEAEVAAVLELPLRALRDGRRRRRPLVSRGVPVPTLTFTVDGHVVWGATARILDDLLKRLAPVV